MVFENLSKSDKDKNTNADYFPIYIIFFTEINEYNNWDQNRDNELKDDAGNYSIWNHIFTAF